MEEKTCCCKKTKERTPEEYKSLIHRLNRIEGQIRGIRGMVEKNAYCTDIPSDRSSGRNRDISVPKQPASAEKMPDYPVYRDYTDNQYFPPLSYG